MKSMSLSCCLCYLDLPQYPILDEHRVFCCSGCHAVYNILSCKNQLHHVQDHPLFQQAVRSGLISNPLLLEQLRSKSLSSSGEPGEKLYLEIGEMWCPSCAEIIRLILLQEQGVKQCLVDYATDLASIEFNPRYISKERLIAIIQSLGYQPAFLLEGERKAVSFSLYIRFIVAAFFSLNIMMFSYPLYATYFDFDDQGVGPLFAWLSGLAAIPVLFYSGWPILTRAWLSLKVGIPSMEVLVAIGVLSAFVLSLQELWIGGIRVYFDSMTVIIAFVLLGKIIEAKAKFSAKDSLFRLSRAMPRRGRKQMETGKAQFVPIKEIVLGDIVIALTGEKIVLDGCVHEGEGTCDESLMTGEAFPVAKKQGDPVLGGTVLQSGWIAYRVSATAEESMLQRIIQMVERDIGHKTHYIRAADRLIRWFVPCIIAIALLSALYVLIFKPEQAAIVRFLSVLLISCPCAIGIAAPLAEAHLMNGLAKIGAIVRNRGCLPFLGKESIFVFDKTGTITEGRFQLMRGYETLKKEELQILKSMCAKSTHPVAQAIFNSISVEMLPLEKIEEHAGQGMKGIYRGQAYYLGSRSFLQRWGFDVQLLKQQSLVTPAFFGGEGKMLACLELGDTIKDKAKEVIEQLDSKTMLLSGDTVEVVAEVGRQCGFDEFYGNKTPLLKKEFIEGLRTQGEIVCMIGDGINDAPALTSANIGISVVSATDISIQVSDLLLTTDNLEVIPKIRILAKRGRKIIQQNLFWAFFYNGIGVGLAAFGALSPIFAAFAMVASSLIVIFNAQRLEKNNKSCHANKSQQRRNIC